MNGTGESVAMEAAVDRRRWWQRRSFKIVATLCFLLCIAAVGAAEYALHHAEPILRKRIVETLSARFDAPVELDRVEISLFKGIEVDGYGLRIPFGPGGGKSAARPMIGVQHFAFRTTVRGLLHQPTHVAGVRVDGLEVHIPPPNARAQMFRRQGSWNHADPSDPKLKPKVAIVVDELHCRDAKLFIESADPGKDPLLFTIPALDMQDPGGGTPMLYDARLINPKPVGEVHAQGHFGPWGGRSAGSVQRLSERSPESAPDPGQTPLDGDYSFDHADLGTIRGLGGTLSSTGHFSGVLDKLVVDGQTDTPDFSLDISNHAVPLHTEFHAIVDGTTGDTYLQPVHARLGQSEFTTAGKIVKIKGQGHDIQLEVTVPHGRMQEFLRLAAKTNPPLLRGVLSMRARLHIAPGRERLAQRLAMAGTFQVQDAMFSKAQMQDRIDGLSARALGHPEEVKEVSQDHRAEAASQLAAAFDLTHGVMTVTDVHYQIPGALVLLNGVYSMDGRLFEFKGHVRTQATASEMIGGWKGMLLKSVDRFLKKDGAGMELPIEISGTEGDMHVGLAMHGTDQTPRQMLTEVREKQREKHEMELARRESALADAEDAQAAKAPTLAAAEQAHTAAVRHRAEAQNRSAAAQRAPGGP